MRGTRIIMVDGGLGLVLAGLGFWICKVVFGVPIWLRG